MFTSPLGLLRIDMRRRRADELSAAIMKEIGPLMYDPQEAYKRLFDLFQREGVEVLTDEMRADAGLPARGPDGWTVEELHILEKRRLEAMSTPPTLFVPLSKADSQGV